jgi:hypothetical protein
VSPPRLLSKGQPSGPRWRLPTGARLTTSLKGPLLPCPASRRGFLLSACLVVRLATRCPNQSCRGVGSGGTSDGSALFLGCCSGRATIRERTTLPRSRCAGAFFWRRSTSAWAFGPLPPWPEHRRRKDDSPLGSAWAVQAAWSHPSVHVKWWKKHSDRVPRKTPRGTDHVIDSHIPTEAFCFGGDCRGYDRER